MNPDLSKYRYYHMNEMFNLVKREEGKESYQALHDSL